MHVDHRVDAPAYIFRTVDILSPRFPDLGLLGPGEIVYYFLPWPVHSTAILLCPLHAPNALAENPT